MLEALNIISQSWPIAAIVLFVCVCIGIAYASYRSTRTDPLQHQETMAKLETEHRERMLKINREQPRLVDGTKANVVEN